MNIVGKFVDLAGFAAHVAGLSFGAWRPSFVVVHNTSAPSLANYAEWRAHPERHGNWTPEQWGRNLQSYYAGMGWNAGPHAFVCPDGVLLFTPFTQRGTHSPAWNSKTWGIETVGEFEREPFDNGSKTNLIGVLGILHAKAGLDPAAYRFGQSGIHFHKEDPVTTHKTCPGRNMVKADLVRDVVAYMAHAAPADGAAAAPQPADMKGHMDVPLAVHTADSSALTGDELTSIKWVQAGLVKLGFLVEKTPGAEVDGIAGSKTRAAVRSFEAAKGLSLDTGIAGPQVRGALKAALAKTV